VVCGNRAGKAVIGFSVVFFGIWGRRPRLKWWGIFIVTWSAAIVTVWYARRVLARLTWHNRSQIRNTWTGREGNESGRGTGLSNHGFEGMGVLGEWGASLARVDNALQQKL